MVGGSHVVTRYVGWKIAQETLSNHYIRMEVTFHLQGEYSDFITDQTSDLVIDQRLSPSILGIGTIPTLPCFTMRSRKT